MKVFIITTSSFPNGMADTKRIICYAKAILTGGGECEVVIYKRNSGFGNYSKEGVEDGIPYHYVGNSPKRSKQIILARITDIIDRVKLLFYLKKHVCKDDVIFCYGSLYTTILINRMHNKGIKIVSNLTEYPFLSKNRSSLSRIFKHNLLNRIFPRFDGVIAISDALMSYAAQYVSSRCQLLKIPILVDFEKYCMEDLSFEGNGRPFIFHAGSLVESKDGIMGMIEAFGKFISVFKLDVDFISTGLIENSPHSKELHDLIHQYHLEKRVHFVGFLDNEKYLDYLQRARLVIINKKETLQNIYCFSTKLGEYMAAGKNIIITKVGEAMNWVRNGLDVYVVAPDNTNELAEMIEYVFSHPEISKNISNQARVTCQRSFDYKNYGTKMIEYFSSL